MAKAEILKPENPKLKIHVKVLVNVFVVSLLMNLCVRNFAEKIMLHKCLITLLYKKIKRIKIETKWFHYLYIT